MIMVMLGGLTMWIDPKSVPARVSMGRVEVYINYFACLLFRYYHRPDDFDHYYWFEVITAARFVLDGARYLSLDVLLFRVLGRS